MNDLQIGCNETLKDGDLFIDYVEKEEADGIYCPAVCKLDGEYHEDGYAFEVVTFLPSYMMKKKYKTHKGWKDPSDYSNLKIVSCKEDTKDLKVGQYYISNWDHQSPHIVKVLEVYEDGYHSGQTIGMLPSTFKANYKDN